MDGSPGEDGVDTEREMAGDDAMSYVEDALVEAHHLANLTDLETAKLARRSLVNAQSASRTAKRRDLLRQAAEYLELARLERRDTAAGFAEAQRLTTRAESSLREEGALLERPLAGLLDDGATRPRAHRRSLTELREEAAVGSFEQLRYDVLLDDLFDAVREDEASADGDGVPGDVDPEEALRLAHRELEEAAVDG
jgi:hypothetical protein